MKLLALLATALALCAATAWVFAPAAELGFVSWDDPDYVTANDQVQQGLTAEGVAWALRPAGAAGNWHPLTWLSHMLDVERHGLDPAGHHRTSVWLHAANAALCFLALALATRRALASLLVALVFALHPLRVESVAWVSERKDVLSGAFALLTLLLWVAWARRGGPVRYAAVALALALGLAAKPMLVTLPCVLLLLDWWPLARLFRGARPRSAGAVAPERRRGAARLVAEALPLFALAAASVVLTLGAQAGGGSIRTTEELPLAARLLHAPWAWLRYLSLSFAPRDLACFYPHPAVVTPERLTLGSPPVWGGLVLLVAVTALAWRLRRRAPELLVGWLWFAGTLVPVIGLVQVGGQAIADRYTYLPSIGLAVAVVFPLARLAGEGRTRAPLRLAAGVLLLGLVLACVPLARATRAQIATWRDSQTLFAHALAATEHNYKAHNSYGVTLEAAGRLDEAAEQYEAALAIRPEHPQALCNLGKVRYARGDLAGAEELFRRSLASDPDLVPALGNLAAVLLTRGRLEEGVALLERALELREDHALHHQNLGIALGMLGRSEEARVHRERAAELEARAAALREGRAER